MTYDVAPGLAQSDAVSVSKIKQLLFSIAIILVPFGNTMLGDGPLGVFGRSPSAFPMLALSFIIIFEKLRTARYNVWVFAYIILFAATSLYFIVYFDFEFLGRSLFDKTFNTAALHVAVLVPAMWYRAPPKSFMLPVLFAGAVLLLGFVAGDLLGLPGVVDNPFLQATANLQFRPRGFASEASVFGSQLIVIGAVCALLMPGRMGRLVTLAVFCAVAASISSKGAIATIVLAGIGALIFHIFRRAWLATVLSIFVVVVLFLLPQTQELVSEVSVSNSGSFGTRGAVAYAAVLSVVQHPLGAGFGALAPALIEVLFQSVDTFRDQFGLSLDYTELYTQFLQASSDRFITTKSGMMDFAIMCGLPGVILLFWLFLRPIFSGDQKLGFLASFALLAGLISVSAYISLVSMYHLTVLVVVVCSLQNYRAIQPHNASAQDMADAG